MNSHYFHFRNNFAFYNSLSYTISISSVNRSECSISTAQSFHFLHSFIHTFSKFKKKIYLFVTILSIELNEGKKYDFLCSLRSRRKTSVLVRITFRTERKNRRSLHNRINFKSSVECQFILYANNILTM